MKKQLSIKTLFMSVSLALGATALVSTAMIVSSSDVYAQASEKKTRKTPALRSKVYEQLARAQSAADEGDIAAGIAVLDEVNERSSSMNSYELAMMYNFYGFIYYNDEQYDKALEYFDKVVEQQPIPVTFEQTTLFSLAQLHLMQGNYGETINYLDRYEALSDGKIPPKTRIIKAQAYYQNKQYLEAGELIEKAIADHEADGYLPDEGWLILQRAVYYEMKQPAKVKDVLVKMVKLFNEPKYWTQLAGMYGELGQEKKQLAMMEAAYQQGFIESASDIFNLAQLYYFHDVPYKGAKLMQQAIDEGVLEKNLRNLKFMAQSWSLAKETDKAIPVMEEAAAMADDGELDAQLAQLFLNSDQWDKAIAAADRALAKGELGNPGLPHLVKGMSLFNKKQFALALQELAEAEKYKESKRIAEQWGQYVETEKNNFEAIQADLSS
jgi:tetratricopeptide (TPR) repeat protein